MDYYHPVEGNFINEGGEEVAEDAMVEQDDNYQNADAA